MILFGPRGPTADDLEALLAATDRPEGNHEQPHSRKPRASDAPGVPTNGKSSDE